MSVSLNETETPAFYLVLFCVMLCETLGSEEGKKRRTHGTAEINRSNPVRL